MQLDEHSSHHIQRRRLSEILCLGLTTLFLFFANDIKIVAQVRAQYGDGNTIWKPLEKEVQTITQFGW
jgi:hypothetical protein